MKRTLFTGLVRRSLKRRSHRAISAYSRVERAALQKDQSAQGFGGVAYLGVAQSAASLVGEYKIRINAGWQPRR